MNRTNFEGMSLEDLMGTTGQNRIKALEGKQANPALNSRIITQRETVKDDVKNKIGD